jgi:hypothetical protein
MKLVANIQLTPTKADSRALKRTLETCGSAHRASVLMVPEWAGGIYRSNIRYWPESANLRQQVLGCLRYTGRDADALGKAAPEPGRTCTPPGLLISRPQYRALARESPRQHADLNWIYFNFDLILQVKPYGKDVHWPTVGVVPGIDHELIVGGETYRIGECVTVIGLKNFLRTVI